MINQNQNIVLTRFYPLSGQREIDAMLQAYRANVAERDLQGIPPKPLDPKWTAGLVELLKNPPADEVDFLIDLMANRVLPGVDEAAYRERFE